MLQREGGVRDALAHGQAYPVGERVAHLTEAGDLAVGGGVVIVSRCRRPE